jgi:hypothetical protein
LGLSNGRRVAGGFFGLLGNLARPIIDDATDLPAVRFVFQTSADERVAPDITHALTGAAM